MVEANCPPASSRKPRTAIGPDWNAAVTRRAVAVLTVASSGSGERVYASVSCLLPDQSERTWPAAPDTYRVLRERADRASFCGSDGDSDDRQSRRGLSAAVCVCLSSAAGHRGTRTVTDDLCGCTGSPR